MQRSVFLFVTRVGVAHWFEWAFCVIIQCFYSVTVLWFRILFFLFSSRSLLSLSLPLLPSISPFLLPCLPPFLFLLYVFPSLSFKNPHLLLYFSFKPHLSVSPVSPEFRTFRDSASEAISVHSQSLKRGTNTLWKQGLSILCSTTRKTNCTRAILLSTLTSNLLPLPCFLTSPLRDVIVQHLRASKRSFFPPLSCVKPIPLSYISASAPRSLSTSPPSTSNDFWICVCLLLAIKQQIPGF